VACDASDDPAAQEVAVHAAVAPVARAQVAVAVGWTGTGGGDALGNEHGVVAAEGGAVAAERGAVEAAGGAVAAEGGAVAAARGAVEAAGGAIAVAGGAVAVEHAVFAVEESAVVVEHDFATVVAAVLDARCQSAVGVADKSAILMKVCVRSLVRRVLETT
jgi:hypothetical protein